MHESLKLVGLSPRAEYMGSTGATGSFGNYLCEKDQLNFRIHSLAKTIVCHINYADLGLDAKRIADLAYAISEEMVLREKKDEK